MQLSTLETNMRQLDHVKWLRHISTLDKIAKLNHFVGNFTKFSHYMVRVKTLVSGGSGTCLCS